jgi:hypothetical protein
LSAKLRPQVAAFFEDEIWLARCSRTGVKRSLVMREHATLPPLSHTRAAARGRCAEGGSDGLSLLVLELALACLETAALGHQLMSLQDVADESEARAAEALAAASSPDAKVGAMRVAMEAAASLADAERAEFATATRWAEHVVASRELAKRALRVVSESTSRRLRPPQESAG